MAVTIHTSPQLYTPSDNPVEWVFSSNQTGQPNFSYIVEVYINGSLTGRHKVFPQVGARSFIDVSETTISTTSVATVPHTTLQKDAGNYQSCYIIVREYYGATPAYGASATSATIYTFKASLSNEERQAWDYTDFVPTATDKRFFTDSPNTLNIPVDKHYYLTIITNNMADRKMLITLKDSTGTLITSSETAIGTRRITQFNVGAQSIVDNTSVTQLQMDQAESVEISILETVGDTTVSETKIYIIDRDTCGRPSYFVWLNKYGAFDQFNFKHNRIYSSTVKSLTYGKPFGEWQGTEHVLDAANSGTLTYLKTAKDRLQVVSDFIDQEQQNYLVESMYISPLVYWSSDSYQRLEVLNSSYELQDDRYEEEFTEVVELALPNERKSVTL